MELYINGESKFNKNKKQLWIKFINRINQHKKWLIIIINLLKQVLLTNIFN